MDCKLIGVVRRGSSLEREESEAIFLKKGSIWMGSLNLYMHLKHRIEARDSGLQNNKTRHPNIHKTRHPNINKEVPGF